VVSGSVSKHQTIGEGSRASRRGLSQQQHMPRLDFHQKPMIKSGRCLSNAFLQKYHVQTNNRNNFLSTDFGLKEFNVKSEKKSLKSAKSTVFSTGRATLQIPALSDQRSLCLSITSGLNSLFLKERILEIQHMPKLKPAPNDHNSIDRHQPR
jgi:hypothetical protein